MQDLQLWHVGSSSLTRDQTWAPALGAKSFSHWTTRGSPKNIFYLDFHCSVEYKNSTIIVQYDFIALKSLDLISNLNKF